MTEHTWLTALVGVLAIVLGWWVYQGFAFLSAHHRFPAGSGELLNWIFGL